MKRNLFVVGNFPPPLNGQNIQTKRCAELLSGEYDVVRVDTSIGSDRLNDAAGRMSRVRHYASVRRDIHRAVANRSQAPVIWHTISPQFAGHLRDKMVTMPPLRRNPVHAVVHWGNFDSLFQRSLTRRSALKLVDSLASIVFLDTSLADRCAPWIDRDKIHIVQNTIDSELQCAADEIQSKQRSFLETERPFRLLFVANMIASKGYLEALEATAILTRRGIDVELELAGIWANDVDKIAFDTRCHDLQIAQRVTHHGAIRDRHRLKELFLRSDAFLLPTTYPTEAQPLSIIEALNAGTPVVATQHAGIPAMVRSEVEALLIREPDPDDIASQVTRLLDKDLWLQLSRNGRDRFEQTYAPDVVRSAWLKVLRTTQVPRH